MPGSLPRNSRLRLRLRRKQPHGCSFRTQQGAYALPSRTINPFHTRKLVVLEPQAVAEEKLASVSAYEHPDPTSAGRGLHTAFRRMVLLRKEVIQPHLPVRLPCYDFVPIASPTFDGSLHKGWATGFGCCRLS